MRRPAVWILLLLGVLGVCAYSYAPLRKAVREWLVSERKILAWEGPAARTTGPNVLIVVLDATRRDALSPYAGAGRNTPAAKALARQGIVFDSCFSAATFSGPSYASLLTGTWPATHGVLDHPEILGPENRTLLEVARETGYYTLFFTQHRYLRDRWGYPQGALFYRYHPDAGVLESELEGWIRAHPGRPFFAFLALTDPHWPYQGGPAGEEARARLPARDQELLASSSPYDMKYGLEETGLSPQFAPTLRRLYQGEVEHDDHLVQRLLQSLEKTGRRQNTIVVYTADHGETFGEHGFYFVHDCEIHAEVSQVPLIVSWPSRLHPGRVGTPVSLTDVYPSIAKWIGGDPGSLVEGRPLPLRDQAGSHSRIPVCFTRPLQTDRAGYRTIRERYPRKGPEGSSFMAAGDRWSLVLRPAVKGMAWEAFDRLKDPLQKKNLWAEARNQPEILALKDRLEAFLTRYLEASRKKPASQPSPEQKKELEELGYLEDS
ncbi:MAG: sulfatase [Planctomycetota bacterium]